MRVLLNHHSYHQQPRHSFYFVKILFLIVNKIKRDTKLFFKEFIMEYLQLIFITGLLVIYISTLNCLCVAIMSKIGGDGSDWG